MSSRLHNRLSLLPTDQARFPMPPPLKQLTRKPLLTQARRDICFRYEIWALFLSLEQNSLPCSLNYVSGTFFNRLSQSQFQFRSSAYIQRERSERAKTSFFLSFFIFLLSDPLPKKRTMKSMLALSLFLANSKQSFI